MTHSERRHMKKIRLTIPLIPPSLNRYHKGHWAERSRIHRTWKEYVRSQWLRLGRPAFDRVEVSLHFHFPDRRHRDHDNYMATGSKLVGDAIKGLFIPDDDPRHLRGWSFRFSMDRKNPRTVIELKEV